MALNRTAWVRIVREAAVEVRTTAFYFNAVKEICELVATSGKL
jgi:hypothetical protein